MLQSETVRKYDTYKDSGIEWIGEIPKEWNTITLKRVFSNRDGGAWGEEPQNNENDRICIRIADFDYPQMTIKHDIDYTVRNYTTDVIEKLTLQKNDILIEKSGGGDQTPVGRTIIFNEDFNALYANFMDRLRVKQSISPKFIEYLLVSFYQNGITYQYIKQTTGIQNLDLTNLLAKESIVLPILDEQQKIADYLDKKCGEIDRVVETEKSVIEKLKEYKQSIITEAVTKGLDKSVPLKDSGIEWIGKIPQHWDVCKLLKLYKERKCKNIGNIETNVLSLSYGNIKKRNVKNNMGLLPESFETYNIVIPNNIVLRLTDLQNDHKSLRCGLVKEQGIITSAYVTLEKKIDRISSNYYYRLLYTFDIMKGFYGMGDGVRQNLKYDGELCNLLVVKPPFEEQQQIAKYLDNKCSEIDKAIADKEQVIEKFTEYKKSLIYECVTGKRKVV